MDKEKSQVKGPAKSVRVSTDLHTKLRAYQHTVHANSMEDALQHLLGETTIRISMPAEVMARWQAEAEASGFPMDQWVAQRVEGYLANRSYAGEVRRALNELVALRQAAVPGSPEWNAAAAALAAPRPQDRP